MVMSTKFTTTTTTFVVKMTVMSMMTMMMSSVTALPLPQNAGSGGDAYTGVGGQANGGSNFKENSVNLLNFGSGNAGAAGDATSGLAGAGAGGSDDVRSLAFISKPSPAHNVLDLNLLHPNPRRLGKKRQAAGNGGNAYTGVGGQANGGSQWKQGTIDILNFNSNNAGAAGDATSGAAAAGVGGSDSSNIISQSIPSSSSTNAPKGSLLNLDFLPHAKRHDGGDGYTGSGGQANGGSQVSSGGLELLNFGSGNAANAGNANSGIADAGNAGNNGGGVSNFVTPASKNEPQLLDLNFLHPRGNDKRQSAGNGGDSYTGAAGQANGGGQWRQGGIDILNFNSNNAGAAGDAASGTALAGKGGSDNTDATTIVNAIPKSPSRTQPSDLPILGSLHL